MTEADRVPSVAQDVLWPGRVSGHCPARIGDGLVAVFVG
jgi:hypothetical protein